MTASPAKRIRWGVLGYARIARELVMPAIGRSTNGELHALASRDPAKLAAARTKYPALAKTFGTYEELLRDPAIDAVYLPLPNSLHREWTIRAAEHGKHVLCEKPLALNAAEAREMAAVCKKSGVVLMEAFMYRYTTRTRQVVELVRTGALGEVRQINAQFRFLLNRPGDVRRIAALGGGALYDVGCYPVNFIGLIADTIAGGAPAAGGLPEALGVVSHRLNDVDENFAAVLRYPNGVLATLQCGFNAHARIGAEIIGTAGVLEIPEAFFDTTKPMTLTSGDQRREIAIAPCDRYQLEVEDFAAAILEKRAPFFPLAESLRNAELMDRLLAAQ
jgi:D-xylose 1-dehydrogenase (NADP+, D-xylono-1,5-lactone-forming)